MHRGMLLLNLSLLLLIAIPIVTIIIGEVIRLIKDYLNALVSHVIVFQLRQSFVKIHRLENIINSL